MNDMRKLMNLTEGIMSVPSAGGSESEMQTAGTIGRNQSYAAYAAATNEAEGDSYEARLGALNAERIKNRKAGMPYAQYEKIFAQGYNQLLKDMPSEHAEHVHAWNQKMWAGNDWQSPGGNRSAVDEGHWWKDPDDDEEEMSGDEMDEYLSSIDYYMSKGNSESKALQLVVKDFMDEGGTSEMARRLTVEIRDGLTSRAQQGNIGESDSSYDADFIRSAISNHYGMATSKEELMSMVAGETGYGGNPNFPAMFDAAFNSFMGADDGAVDDEGAIDEGGAMVPGSRPTDDVSDILPQITSEVDALVSKGMEFYAAIDAVDGKYKSPMVSATLDQLMNNRKSMEEGLNNGYDNVKLMTGSDYFPNGADGPVVSSTGPSGARHGDNPEQKKMQVDEAHAELVYAYRSYLKESKTPKAK
jgi:hypothetical protein